MIDGWVFALVRSDSQGHEVGVTRAGNAQGQFAHGLNDCGDQKNQESAILAR